MGTVEGWKRLAGIVPSPSNGITFDCGVTREMGQDPVEVCRYFGSRDCINHVHFRNVIVRKPYEKYTEVFLDEGEVDMYAVMQELVRQKYPRLIYSGAPARSRRRSGAAGLSSVLSRRRRICGLCVQRGLRAGHVAGGPQPVITL